MEENELSAACVGAPLLNPADEAVAAVSIAGPLARTPPERRAEIGALLVETRADAARRGPGAAGAGRPSP